MIDSRAEQLLQSQLSFSISQDKGKQCISYAYTTVTNSAAVSLPTAPSHATYALIRIEADASQAASLKVVRFRLDGTAPTSSVGSPLNDEEVLVVTNVTNIQNAQIIGVTSGKTHTIHVHYFYAS